jgi:hypothetical protein
MVSLQKARTPGEFYIKNETEEPGSEDPDLNQKMFIVVRNTKSTENNLDY